jgi:hypothetical protein
MYTSDCLAETNENRLVARHMFRAQRRLVPLLRGFRLGVLPPDTAAKTSQKTVFFDPHLASFYGAATEQLDGSGSTRL